MTLYQRCAHYGNLHMQSVHDCDGYMPVEDVMSRAEWEATINYEAARERMNWHAEKGHWSTWPLDELTNDILRVAVVEETP